MTFVGRVTANPHESKLVHQGDLEVQRLAAHGKCNRVAYESGLYFSFNFSLLVDMGALWIAKDQQDLSWGV